MPVRQTTERTALFVVEYEDYRDGSQITVRDLHEFVQRVQNYPDAVIKHWGDPISRLEVEVKT